MRTPTLIAALLALAGGAVCAQPDPSAALEERLLGEIAALQAQAGSARPAELAEPLRRLALLYEEGGDHALASATLDEARYVTRIHAGLTSAAEALLLRQQIRSERALGQHRRAWDLEQDMVTIARHHLADPSMLSIFRELAADRLTLIDLVAVGERPPTIYAGCYNGEPLPPYDFTRKTARAIGTSTGVASPSCIGGVNEWLVAKLRSEILMYYADAIEIILRTGDYASQELRELERAAIRVASHRTVGAVRASSESSGPLASCSRGTLEHYLELDILSSCLAPVARGNNFVIANVGGRIGLIRLLSYEVRAGAPPAVRAGALAELADWHVLAVPADRRRFLGLELAHALYQGAYDDLERNGAVQAARQLFAADPPVTLPTYEPNPFAAATAESPRYIDVAFDVTRYGTAEHVRILAASLDATRAEERELVRLLESSTFRPRFVAGKVADAAPVVARYSLR